MPADVQAVSQGDDPPDSLGDTTAALAPLLDTAQGRTLQGLVIYAPSPTKGRAPLPPAVGNALEAVLTGRNVPQRFKLGLRAALLVYEKGIPYVWGGTDPNRGLDCSGYARYVLRAAGVTNIARVTYDQAKQGRAVSPQHLQVLDLVFGYPERQGPGHVMIYMADGYVLHEPHPGLDAEWLKLPGGVPIVSYRRYLPDLIKGIAGLQLPLPLPKLDPSKPTYKGTTPKNAFEHLLDHLAHVWPQAGRNARTRGDSLARAIKSGL